MTIKISLRDDQEEVKRKLRVELRTSSSVLVFAPTGFGKTVLGADLMKAIFAGNKRVIFCVHRIDLIKQTAVTLAKFGIPFSYIANGYHYNRYHRVFIASITTLKNRMKNIPADYIIVDEAHLSMADGWFAVAMHYKAAGAKLIGLTGSPERLDGRPLGDAWDVMVLGPSLRWLIEQGRLQRYRAIAPKGLDLAKVRIKGGEYVESELEDLMSGKAVVANAVKHWRQFANGLRTIGFCTSVARSEQHAYEFRQAGINAVSLDATSDGDERKRVFNAFADREIDVLFNCNLFCEGFDLAAQVERDVVIECVLDNAPTMSLARHLQKHGRGLRKEAHDIPHVLLDMVGGFDRLGYPDDDREWSLHGRVKNHDKDEVQNMQCPKCMGSHRPALVCEYCDYVYPVKEKGAGATGGRSLDAVEVELEERDVDAIRAAADKDQTDKFWKYWQSRGAGNEGRLTQ